MGSGPSSRSKRRPYELKATSSSEDGTYVDPRSPTVSELKNRLAELGVEVPAGAVEKSELVAAIQRGELDRRKLDKRPPGIATASSSAGAGGAGGTWVEPFSPTASSPSAPCSPVQISETPSAGGCSRGSCVSPKTSVAELKSRLRALGLKVPTSIVEKSELLALVIEAERQASFNGNDPASASASSMGAAADGVAGAAGGGAGGVPGGGDGGVAGGAEGAASAAAATGAGATEGERTPKAPSTLTACFQIRQRLKELGIEAPAGTNDETELLLLLKATELSQPCSIERTITGDVTLSCTRRANGVARIELTQTSAPGAAEGGGLDTTFSPDDVDGGTEGGGGGEGLVSGRTFSWARGECIGHGASGTVFKAMNYTTGKLMAVKEVHMDLKRKADEHFKAALENEIQLMQDLRHPNIVAYFGSDWIDNRVYMYLEYMAGGSISRVLDQFGPFEESLIANYGRQLLNGLEYLHTRNPYIVHRDIKGANVLLGIDCTVKLADFGCSKREQETRSLTFGGSIPWMAPEVVAHARYGRAGDIWSFGCLVIEMATAAPPWGEFDNLMAAMIKIGMSSEMPAMPSGLTPRCRSFIRRCLNRDPGKRLSASELLNERFILSGGSIDSSDPLLEGEELLASELVDGRPGPITEEEDEEAADGDGGEEPLPRGWEKHFDPNYSEWYYWHCPTGRSTWVRPASGGDSDTEAAD